MGGCAVCYHESESKFDVQPYVQLLFIIFRFGSRFLNSFRVPGNGHRHNSLIGCSFLKDGLLIPLHNLIEERGLKQCLYQKKRKKKQRIEEKEKINKREKKKYAFICTTTLFNTVVFLLLTIHDSTVILWSPF